MCNFFFAKTEDGGVDGSAIMPEMEHVCFHDDDELAD